MIMLFSAYFEKSKAKVRRKYGNFAHLKGKYISQLMNYSYGVLNFGV